jgi:hypothetical protein
MGVVLAKKRELEARAITAHLLRATQLAGVAASELLPSSERRKKNDEALQEILTALQLKGDDLDALELAAKQSLLLGEESHALGYLERMARAAKDSPLRHARALRLQAEIREKENTSSSLDAARGLLIAAIEEVLLPIKQASLERTFELAKCYRVRGEVQLKRERYTASQTALAEAKSLFQRLAPSIAAEGLASTEDALERLAQAKKDREAPGD